MNILAQEMKVLAHAVLEIFQSNGRFPNELIEAGYRSSQHGLVVFVLNNVTPEYVNLVLDPIVATMSLSIPGVLYVKIGDKQSLHDAVACAPVVYVASNAFFHLAVGYGASAKLVFADFFPSVHTPATRSLPPESLQNVLDEASAGIIQHINVSSMPDRNSAVPDLRL